MASTTLTPRRSSRRTQPSDLPTQPAQASSSSSASSVLHTRNVKVALDLTPDQWDELRGTDIKTMQTHFLSHYTTKLTADALPKRVYGKAKRPSLPQSRDVLKIGDTVLVELGGASTSREPSVAVVTGVWKVMIGEEVFCVDVGVHWFVRPSQLPRVRAAREHLENEIYYSLSENDVVPLDAVVGHCTVTSNKNDNDDPQTFYCIYATHTQKGLFYTFNWSSHRSSTLHSSHSLYSSSSHSSLTSAPHSSHASLSHYWELGRNGAEGWDVGVVNPPETPKKVKQPAVVPRRVARPRLEEVREDEEEEDEEGGETGKRKRSRTSLGSAVKTKRPRMAESEASSSEGEGEEGEGALPVVKTARGKVKVDKEGEDGDEDEGAVPRTPSRRGRGRGRGRGGGRGKAVTTPSTRPTTSPKKTKALRHASDDDKLEESEDSGSEHVPSSESESESEGEEDEEFDGEGDNGEEDGEEEFDEDEEEEDGYPRTPSRRGRRTIKSTPTRKTTRTTPRKGRSVGTPRRPRTTARTLALPTPHSKAALRARRHAKFRAPLHNVTLNLGMGQEKEGEGEGEWMGEEGEGDRWVRAMGVLHVGSRPSGSHSHSRKSQAGDSKDEQEPQEEGGREGTETAREGSEGNGGDKEEEETAREGSEGREGRQRDVLPCREREYESILRAVEELLEEGSGGCVYISGVPGTGKTATVHAVVRELKRMAELNEANPFTYVEINGLRIPEPAAAYNLLWEALSGTSSDDHGSREARVSAKEALKRLTKHFGQGVRYGPGGHACIVLMDELDQLMTAKQDVVYNFFNWPTLVGSKLVVLAVANTMDLPERVMSGRVRSRLGMTRINFQPYTTPQLEQIVNTRLQHAHATDVIAPDGVKFAAMKVASVSGDARRVLDICRRAVELVQPHGRMARTDDVKRVIVDMQNSPTAAYLRELSFHERLMLLALLRVVKREGVDEVKWGDVQRQHLLHLTVLASDSDTTRAPTPGELSMVLDSLVASRAVLYEEGMAAARKREEERRMVLNVEGEEVERVLGEVGGAKWRNALNI